MFKKSSCVLTAAVCILMTAVQAVPVSAADIYLAQPAADRTASEADLPPGLREDAG